jgi:putative ABC transporter-associated repeat protein
MAVVGAADDGIREDITQRREQFMSTNDAPTLHGRAASACPTSRARVLRAGIAILSMLSMFVVGLAASRPAMAVDSGQDPNLAQVIPANEPVVHGNHVIPTGHVDMGPRFDNGTWRFLIHDDAHKADASATSVWRYPAETVLQVVDKAKLTVPEDKTYDFVGAAPGSTVWVVPQTQNPNVVWAGWNTQDPTVMSRLDRGATFTVSGIQGPGTLVVYLQSGSFGEPQVLWDSRKPGKQPVWVDTNTHTHANWVFTKPGVYLVRINASANLKDGSHVSDTQYIRFAVGSATSTASALSTRWRHANAQTSDEAAGHDSAASSDSSRMKSLWVPLLIWILVALAVLMVIGFVLAVLSSNRTRRRILSAANANATASPWPSSVGESEQGRPSGGSPGPADPSDSGVSRDEGGRR